MRERNERNFIEALLEGGEAALDLLTENEAVEAVPVIGTAIKVLKGVDDVRSRALSAKLQNWQETAHVTFGAEWKQPLAGPGLPRIVAGQTIDDIGSVNYELTELGRTLYRSLWHARTV